MQERGNDWLLKPLPEPERGRYYLECSWCLKRDTGFNWKCTSPAMFVDTADPDSYPLPSYLCDECKAAVFNSLPIVPRRRYSDYLESDHWQGVRVLALRRSGNKCQLCAGKKTLDVHHNSYARLGHEQPEDVVVLCRKCHAKHHDKEVCYQVA